MQSGISVSKELHQAFQELSSPGAPRGILATIRNEQIVPQTTIPSHSADFLDDVSGLADALSADEAAYLVLRRHDDAADGLVAVTYVPDGAPVRQKMLFAATRLTLVRELGPERFRDTLFATTKQELAPDGWRRHDAHGAQAAPLTDEEQALQGVRAAEAEASRGTTAKSAHVSSGLSFPVAAAALQALRGLETAEENLVQLKIDVSRESIELVSATPATPDAFAAQVSDAEPRFSFFRYAPGAGTAAAVTAAAVVFVYTCPAASRIKERMLYASSRAGVLGVAGDEAGLTIAKKLEATSPSEITTATFEEEFAPRAEGSKGFARPKRPGRR